MAKRTIKPPAARSSIPLRAARKAIRKPMMDNGEWMKKQMDDMMGQMDQMNRPKKKK